MSILDTLDRRRQARDDADASIDPRIEARRREVLALRRARRKRWLLAVAVVATLGAVAYGVAHSPLLDVDDITVSGATHTQDDVVRAASGIAVGDHLVGLDTARAEQQVQALPWVRDVSIDRSWAGTVAITVTERTPVAALAATDGSGWLLVDDQRRVVATLPAAPTELPALSGLAPVAVGQYLDPRADDALRVARALPAGVRSRVTEVRIGDGGTIELALRPTGVVRFGGAADLGVKMQSLQTVFGQVDLSCLAAVDLRVPDAPVLTRDRSCA